MNILLESIIKLIKEEDSVSPSFKYRKKKFFRTKRDAIGRKLALRKRHIKEKDLLDRSIRHTEMIKAQNKQFSKKQKMLSKGGDDANI
jgi:hypothetical protein